MLSVCGYSKHGDLVLAQNWILKLAGIALSSVNKFLY